MIIQSLPTDPCADRKLGGFVGRKTFLRLNSSVTALKLQFCRLRNFTELTEFLLTCL